MTTPKTKLFAVMANLWEATMTIIPTLEVLAVRAPNTRTRSRLYALAAGSQAHASRLLARLAAAGGGPLPVPSSEVKIDPDFVTAMRAEAARARDMAERYANAANDARRAMDPSAAWVCEINRAEELDRAFEMAETATRHEMVKPKRNRKEVRS